MKLKKQIKPGVKKAVNVALIIKIGVSALALLTVLGVVGSLFSGSSSGSSSGGSTVRPSRPGTSAPDTERPEETDVPDVPDVPSVLTKATPKQENFNIYLGADELSNLANTSVLGNKLVKGISRSEVLYDGTVPFLRMYGNGTSAEAYAQVANIEGQTTGKYLTFAYRLPTSNTESHNFFQIYANTTGAAPSGNGDLFEIRTYKDDKWHVVAIDIEAAIANSKKVYDGVYGSQFNGNSDGTYTIKRLRIDFFNQLTSTDSYIDVAYIGICNSLELARSADVDYTGYEYNAERLLSQSWSAVSGVYNGMEYVTVTATTDSSKEAYIQLFSNERITPNVSRYVGVLYRNAPGGSIEFFSSSNTTYVDCSEYVRYDTSEGWHFAVVDLRFIYEDSVCRRLRLDYFNSLEADTEYSIDFAFIKFFSSESEANAYYQDYVNTYNLNAE